MIDELYIASKNVNLEIVAKLLNSVAEKYDCCVRYDQKKNSLEFFGDDAYWRHIVEEVLALFFPLPQMRAVRI
jgi:hypothetical protein